MDITLNNYLNRAECILQSNAVHNEHKRNQNEIKQMITHVESTLLLLKEKYKTYTTNDQKMHTSALIQNAQHISLYTDQPTIKLNIINETNQYKLKINNLVLVGNIGNIYDKNMLLNDRVLAHQVVPCKYDNTCKNVLLQKYCKYYHEPQQLLLLKNEKIISAEYYTKAITFVRNFSNTSWLYSSVHTPNTRCLGSKTSLANDMQIATLNTTYKQNIVTMKQQVMHDILVLLALNERNLA